MSPFVTAGRTCARSIKIGFKLMRMTLKFPFNAIAKITIYCPNNGLLSGLQVSLARVCVDESSNSIFRARSHGNFHCKESWPTRLQGGKIVQTDRLVTRRQQIPNSKFQSKLRCLETHPSGWTTTQLMREQTTWWIEEWRCRSLKLMIWPSWFCPVDPWFFPVDPTSSSHLPPISLELSSLFCFVWKV